MPSSAELDRSRWSWSTEAVGRLRAELRGIDDRTEHADLAHVMVIGDTQVGKTTLLLRLLGVNDPAAMQQAALPLRGGRERGESATAVPIRYQWSGLPDHWSLVHGPQRRAEWLDSAALAERLTAFRCAGELTWDPAERPLEIGLPERLADPAQRRDLRVFDLPGLYAAEPQEQDVARTLIADYAPVMNFIVFVLSGDQFAEQLDSPTIAENPFLCTWGAQPDRFHLVFTRAFSNAMVREYLRDRLADAPHGTWDADSILALAREYYADQLSASGLPAGRPQTLFPVDIGDTWRELVEAGSAEDRAYAAAVASTNDRLLAGLGQTIVGFSDEDSAHLAAPEIARRVAVQVQASRQRRQGWIDAADAAVADAAQARADAERLVVQAAAALEQATARARRVRSGHAELATLPVAYQRPAAPPMKGPLVRGKQQEERGAWEEAARSAWTGWRDRQPSDTRFPMLPPNDLRTAIGTEYDKRCACCGNCEGGWRFLVFINDLPDHCYRKMTAVDLRPWIRTRLSAHALPAVEAARRDAQTAEGRLRRTEDNLARRRADEADATATRDAVLERAAPEEAEDAHNMQVATSVRARLTETNQEYVRGLLARADAARGDERALLFVAALRAVHDLDRMFKR